MFDITGLNMLDKHIDPPVDEWDLHDRKSESHDWVDDLFNDTIEIALFNYECKVYNELDRRLRV